jgi:hypothetical protein
MYPTLGMSANVAASSGYVTTRIVGVDGAGNTTVPFTNTVVEDNSSPVVASVDMPPTMTGGSSIAIPASVADNLDIVASMVAVNYASPTNGSGAMSLVYPAVIGPGVAFDNVLTRLPLINPPITVFIKNLQVSNGSSIQTPIATAGDATSVTLSAMDEVSRKGSSPDVVLSPAVALIPGGTSSSFTNFTGGFALGASTNTVSNCGGCTPVNPTAVTFTATATGALGVFANPFTNGVQLWLQVTAGGSWYLGATCGVATMRENATNRFWDYTCTIDPPAFTQDGTSLTPAAGGSISVNVRAIGISFNGDGIASPPVAITVTNP